MSLSLADASAQVGVNRSTLLRSIKSGRLSGTRDEFGTWRIEAAELFRVYPAEAAPKAAPQDAQTDAQVAALREQLAEMRSQRDAWQGIAERLTSALPKPIEQDATPPPPPKRKWWQRR